LAVDVADVALCALGPPTTDDAFVHFHAPLRMRPDECWQERPVRRGFVASPPRVFKSNTGLHGCNLVQLLLRDHGFRRAPPLRQPRLKRHLRRSWFARAVPSACGDDGTPYPPWSLEWRTGRLEACEVALLMPWQRVNKFPGISALTLKSELWRHHQRMQRRHGTAAYAHVPSTFVLPDEYSAWVDACRVGGAHTPLWILKPNHASRGRGISLVRAETVAHDGEAASCGQSTSPCWSATHGVACAYVHRPLLLDGLKFDLRLYVLITSWRPLCIYLYDDGLARFATSPYTLRLDGHPSADATCDADAMCDVDAPAGAAAAAAYSSGMGRTHLTNYSLNESGQRMMLAELKRRLSAKVGEQAALDVWRAVDDVVVKMALSVEEPLNTALAGASRRFACGHPDEHCFELLGIDVLLDAECKPWLLEANLDPSLSTEDVHGTPAGANARLKATMMADTLNLVGVRLPPAEPAKPTEAAAARAEAEYQSLAAGRKLSAAEAHDAARRHVDAEFARSSQGGWRRLLPSALSEEYAPFVGEERRGVHVLPFAKN